MTVTPRLRLTYVVGTYPEPTTTFIDREIEAVARAGAEVRVVSIRRPVLRLSEHQRRLASRVRYVLPVRPAALVRSHLSMLWSRPSGYLGTLAYVLTRPHPSLRARVKTALHFGVAVHVARLVRDRGTTDHVHAHFVDRAALVALVVSRLLGIPYSATAHANDIYVHPVLLPEKTSGAKFVATCTRFNEAHLYATGAAPQGRVRCIYHGLDLHAFAPNGRPARGRPLLLSVGQLKEKKGFRHLLDACRVLADRGVPFECEIIGEGSQRSELEAAIHALGLEDRVALVGALPHEAVVRRYADATAFVLPCVTSPNGDRDGIPNVILEAMAMEVPVVSTRHSGIPEAVTDDVNGLLVPPGDAVALADALERLLGDEALRGRLGRSGRARVAEDFDIEVNARKLLTEFAA